MQEGCAVHYSRYSRWIWAEDIYEVLDCRMGLPENADLDLSILTHQIKFAIVYHITASFFFHAVDVKRLLSGYKSGTVVILVKMYESL